MSCTLNLLNNSLLGEDAGGTLEFLYYDIDCDSIEDTGGSVILLELNGDANFDNAIAGCYWFKYSGGLQPDCYSETIFSVRVLDHVDAGIGTTIGMCIGDDAINIFSLITGTPDLNGTWSGSGILSSGYSNGGTPFDPADDSFDPITPGLYVFTYTVTQVAPDGYTLYDCQNCQSASTDVTISVVSCEPPPEPCNAGSSASVQVCSSTGCAFDLLDQLGGTPDLGGTWLWLSGPQIIIPTGGDNGTVNFLNAQLGTYQFRYTIGECTSIVTVQVVATPNAGCNGTRTLCETSGATSLITSLGCSPQAGGTWSISPVLPVGSFTINGVINPAAGDAGVYIATYTISNPVSGPCGTACIDTATVTVTILEDCFAGNNTTIVLCQDDSIVLDPAVLLGATSTGGTWFCAGQSLVCNNVYGAAVFSVNGGAQQDYQGDPIPNGATLDDFLNLGCISLQYFCNSTPAGCNDFATLILQIVNCPPACSATVSISAIGCAMSSLITGACPSPVYQWQVFSGGNWIPAPGDNDNTTYTGLNGQQYRLRVTGCTGCNALFSNILTLSCPPAPTCTITCMLTYNTTLQRLQAVITNSGSASCSVPYQFNKYVTNNANCLLCNGANIAHCSGNVIVPASSSVQVNCSTPQGSVEECWRFVTLASCCNQTLCCVKVPPITLASYKLTFPLLTGYTAITIAGINYVFGSTAPFNCTEYESTQPTGTMNGIVNCSMAQFVIDLKAKLVALGIAGDVSLWQGSKSSELRIKDTDAVFNSMTRNGGITDAFTIITTVLCDTVTWHLQGLTSIDNFPGSLGLNGYIPLSGGGTVNLFDLIDAYFGGAPVEIPHTGTFTGALCTSLVNGCTTLSQSCCDSGGPLITVHPTTGVVTYPEFTPPDLCGPGGPLGSNCCFWNFRYEFTMPNGCNECIFINLHFYD